MTLKFNGVLEVVEAGLAYM